jgi:glycine oxidase
VTADRPDVLVIGAGLIGLACALELRQHGLRVEVLEAGAPAEGASRAAAGMLAPLGEAGTNALFTDVCFEARDLWRQWAPELAQTSGCDLGYRQEGSLFVGFDEHDESHLDKVKQAASQRGEPLESLTEQEVRKEYPDLSGSVGSALYAPGEALVDPELVASALLQMLRRSGTLVHVQRPVDRIEPSGSSGFEIHGAGWRTTVDKVVLAAGAWSGQFGGAPNWVRPVRGQMIAYRQETVRLRGAVRAKGHYVLRRGAEILCGATVEEVGFDDDTTELGRNQMVDVCLSLLPGLRWKAIARHWAGLRPATPDGLPIIGRRPGQELYFATGHYRNGILLAPWTARAIATQLLGSAEVPSAFSPARFRD